jgi:hypothetical protein
MILILFKLFVFDLNLIALKVSNSREFTHLRCCVKPYKVTNSQWFCSESSDLLYLFEIPNKLFTSLKLGKHHIKN